MKQSQAAPRRIARQLPISLPVPTGFSQSILSYYAGNRETGCRGHRSSSNSPNLDPAVASSTISPTASSARVASRSFIVKYSLSTMGSTSVVIFHRALEQTKTCNSFKPAGFLRLVPIMSLSCEARNNYTANNVTQCALWQCDGDHNFQLSGVRRRVDQAIRSPSQTF